MNKNNYDMNNIEFDVIIVGGGINGLLVGCYLGMEGKRVLVFEVLDKVGGMVLLGYLIFEVLQYLVYFCVMDMMFMCVYVYVFCELEFEWYGFKLIELLLGYVYLYLDGILLVFWCDCQQIVVEICCYSFRDVEVFFEFMKVIDLFFDIVLLMM